MKTKIMSITAMVSDLFNSPKTCSTRMISEGLFECKVKKPRPEYCEYSLSMGNGFVCKHQDRMKFSGK